MKSGILFRITTILIIGVIAGCSLQRADESRHRELISKWAEIYARSPEYTSADVNRFDHFMDSLQLIADQLAPMDSAPFVQLRLLVSQRMFSLGEFQNALENLRFCEQLSFRIKDETLLPSVYYEFGNCYVALGNYDAALAYYFRSLENGFGDPELVYGNLGEVYMAIKDWHLAKRYHKLAVGDSDRMAGNFAPLVNLALTYSRLNNHDSASYYFNQAVSLGDGRLGKEELLLSNARAHLLFENRQFAECTNVAAESLRLSQVTGAHNLAVDNAILLAKASWELNNFAGFNEYLDIADAAASESTVYVNQAELYELRIQAATLTRNDSIICEWQRRYINLANAMYDEARLNKVSALEVEYAQRFNRRSIREQQEVLAMLDKTIHERFRLILLIGAAIVLAIVLILVIIKLNRTNKKMSELLEVRVRNGTSQLASQVQESERKHNEFLMFFRVWKRDMRTYLASIKGIVSLEERSGPSSHRDTTKDVDQIVSQIEEFEKNIKLPASGQKVPESQLNG